MAQAHTCLTVIPHTREFGCSPHVPKAQARYTDLPPICMCESGSSLGARATWARSPRESHLDPGWAAAGVGVAEQIRPDMGAQGSQLASGAEDRAAQRRIQAPGRSPSHELGVPRQSLRATTAPLSSPTPPRAVPWLLTPPSRRAPNRRSTLIARMSIIDRSLCKRY